MLLNALASFPGFLGRLLTFPMHSIKLSVNKIDKHLPFFFFFFFVAKIQDNVEMV